MSNPLYLELAQLAKTLLGQFGREVEVEPKTVRAIDPLTGSPVVDNGGSGQVKPKMLVVEFEKSMFWSTTGKPGLDLPAGSSVVYATSAEGYLAKTGDKVVGKTVVQAEYLQPDGDVVILQVLTCKS